MEFILFIIIVTVILYWIKSSRDNASSNLSFKEQLDKYLEYNRTTAVSWAKDFAENPELDPVVIDTETTGLEDTDEVIELCIMKRDGQIIYHSYFMPETIISKDAIKIHGLTKGKLKNSPLFKNEYDNIKEALKGRTVTGYNIKFDLRLLNQTCERYNLEELSPVFDCAMLVYSAYYGELWPDSFKIKWQKLPGSKHNAKDDCLATLELIKSVANETAPRLSEQYYMNLYT